MSLHNGFSGDQALFLIFSRAIDSGAVLYRDVWDIKQPGIFVFFLVGGKLFGFTEIGIHLLEIIYWLVFCLFLIFSLRNYFSNPLFAALTPLFTVGIYYSVSGSLHLTQVEALVGSPLFLSLWFCQKFLENPDRKIFLFLTGFFGGIVLTLKLMFIVILIGFWICLFLYFYSFIKKDAKRILVLSALIFPGLIIPLAGVIFYFVQNDAFDDLWYTTFVYPSNAVIEITRMENRIAVLKSGLEWFFKSYFPVIVLTLILLLFNLKSLFIKRRQMQSFALRREDFLFTNLFIWAFLGFAVILIQRLSWWEYHYSLLMIPLGILAVKCVEQFIEEINANSKIRRKIPAFLLLIVFIAILFIPTARRLANKIRQSGEVESVEIGNRQIKVTGDAAGDYKSISADTAFLKTENSKVPIFVFSNPLYYYLSDSPPMYASNGAMSDMFTDFEWKRLNREVSEKPPEYIFIETRWLQMIAEEDPDFFNTVNKNYSLYSTGDRGSFYKLNENNN